jgi:acetyltransferase
MPSASRGLARAPVAGYLQPVSVSSSPSFSEVSPWGVRLADGRRVRLRPLVPSDAEALQEAYERLSPQARTSRFGSPPVSLRGDTLSYLVSADGVDHVAFVAVEDLPDDGPQPPRLLGAGRIMRYPDDPQSLDIGLTVADDVRGLGLGRALAAALARHRPRPARRILTAVDRTNEAALRLLAVFGRPVRNPDGLVEVAVD